MILRFALYFFLLFFPLSLQAQSIETMLEEYEDLETDELEAIIRTFVEEPIRINEVALDELKRIWFLELSQIETLMQLYATHFPNIKLRQISDSIGLPMEIVKAIFSVKVHAAVNVFGRNRTIRRLDEGWQQQIRFDAERGNSSFGLITEKDAGEPQLADFSSGFTRHEFPKRGLRLTLGDFTTRAGLGLVAAGAFGGASLTSPESVLRFESPNVRPFRSVQENLAFRGGALEGNRGPVTAFFFASRSSRDARISSEGFASSLPQSGHHRTENEIAAKDALRETSLGASLSVSASSAVVIGANIFRHRYNRPIFSPDTTRNRFAFRGTENLIYGAFMQSSVHDGKFRWLFEWANSDRQNAVVAGLKIRRPESQITIAWWYAEPGFQNAFGALPGEFIGETSNQQTFYFGLRTRKNMGVFTLFAAKSASLWRTFFIPQPSANERLGLQWEKTVFRKTTMLSRFRYGTGDHTTFSDTLLQQRPSDVLLNEKSFQWRLQLQTYLHRVLRYRFRIDISRYKEERMRPEIGLAQMHEFQLRVNPVSGTVRYSYFSIPSFDGRIYQVEYQLPGAVRATAFSGEGERIFGQVGLKLGGSVKLSAYAYHMRRAQRKSSNQFGLQADIYR